MLHMAAIGHTPEAVSGLVQVLWKVSSRLDRSLDMLGGDWPAHMQVVLLVHMRPTLQAW
jgi:hypothetical protein